jgi:general stress protein YciG
MAGTHEGGQKAAETRRENDPDAFRKMGEKGAASRSEESRHEAAVKAAETRKDNDPDAFKKMGEKGGQHSHGGRGNDDDDNRKEKE